MKASRRIEFRGSPSFAAPPALATAYAIWNAATLLLALEHGQRLARSMVTDRLAAPYRFELPPVRYRSRGQVSAKKASGKDRGEAIIDNRTGQYAGR